MGLRAGETSRTHQDAHVEMPWTSKTTREFKAQVILSKAMEHLGQRHCAVHASFFGDSHSGWTPILAADLLTSNGAKNQRTEHEARAESNHSGWKCGTHMNAVRRCDAILKHTWLSASAVGNQSWRSCGSSNRCERRWRIGTSATSVRQPNVVSCDWYDCASRGEVGTSEWVNLTQTHEHKWLGHHAISRWPGMKIEKRAVGIIREGGRELLPFLWHCRSCHCTFYASNPLEKKIFGVNPFRFRSSLEPLGLYNIWVCHSLMDFFLINFDQFLDTLKCRFDSAGRLLFRLLIEVRWYFSHLKFHLRGCSLPEVHNPSSSTYWIYLFAFSLLNLVSFVGLYGVFGSVWGNSSWSGWSKPWNFLTSQVSSHPCMLLVGIIGVELIANKLSSVYMCQELTILQNEHCVGMLYTFIIYSSSASVQRFWMLHNGLDNF